jgi:hypothetical protein
MLAICPAPGLIHVIGMVKRPLFIVPAVNVPVLRATGALRYYLLWPF